MQLPKMKIDELQGIVNSVGLGHAVDSRVAPEEIEDTDVEAMWLAAKTLLGNLRNLLSQKARE